MVVYFAFKTEIISFIRNGHSDFSEWDILGYQHRLTAATGMHERSGVSGRGLCRHHVWARSASSQHYVGYFTVNVKDITAFLFNRL